MVDSGDLKWQVTFFESFGTLKKPRNSEASSSTSVEASVGNINVGISKDLSNVLYKLFGRCVTAAFYINLRISMELFNTNLWKSAFSSAGLQNRNFYGYIIVLQSLKVNTLLVESIFQIIVSCYFALKAAL